MTRNVAEYGRKTISVEVINIKCSRMFYEEVLATIYFFDLIQCLFSPPCFLRFPNQYSCLISR